MNDFVLFEELKIERRNKLIEMVSFFDQTGEPPHPKDIDRIMKLDEEIMKVLNGGEDES